VYLGVYCFVVLLYELPEQACFIQVKKSFSVISFSDLSLTIYCKPHEKRTTQQTKIAQQAYQQKKTLVNSLKR
jgi:hypothetical protein